MISAQSDDEFQLDLWRAELCIPHLLADPHYGPMMRARGHDRELAELRTEWRERQERARARALKYEASFTD